MYWVPKTRLGIKVEKGDIKTMAEALETRLPLREPEIVDILLPDLEDEVLDVNMVQRMTDSGRRVRFAITTVVGNSNGYVGLGKAKGKEVGPTIRKAIDNAKLNIIEVRRGCGSWECGCGKPHSLPFDVFGKKGSVRVTFKPAPRGIALAVGDVAKPVLRLAGIKDAWAFTKGHTKTTANYAQAAFEALKKTAEMRVMKYQEDKMDIISGIIPGTETERVMVESEAEEEKGSEAEKKEQVKIEDSKQEGKGEQKVGEVKKEESIKKKETKEAKPSKKEGEK
ncbi:MAG: 30S ribosomal protein S5 [Thermoplasmata archaeon]|nr:MAG: 30S ribosomal protein S5 [Thermoplasmata archaeon]